MKAKKNIKGMTLTEVMAGAAILLIASLMLASGFGMVIRIMHQGDLIKNAGQLAFGVADGASNTDKKVEDSGISSGNVEITLDSGKKITAKGSYRSYSVGESPYARFEVLDNTEDVAYTIWQQVEDAFRFGSSLTTKEEREKWGFRANGQIHNEAVRDYVLKYIWNGVWPEFPNEILERNGFNVKTTYYIQCRYFATAYSANGGQYAPSTCAITFATIKNTNTSYWVSPLIYDASTRTWYYKYQNTTSDSDDTLLSKNDSPEGAQYVLEHVKSCPNWVALK